MKNEESEACAFKKNLNKKNAFKKEDLKDSKQLTDYKEARGTLAKNTKQK